MKKRLKVSAVRDPRHGDARLQLRAQASSPTPPDEREGGGGEAGGGEA